MANKLAPGDSFPDMTLNLAGGGTINLPQDLTGQFNMVLFYRGHW